MFENIGGKIKAYAKVSCIIKVGIFFLAGIGLFVATEDSYQMDSALRVYGMILLIGGPLYSWISSFMLYGFGELIDGVAHIDWVFSKRAQPPVSAPTVPQAPYPQAPYPQAAYIPGPTIESSGRFCGGCGSILENGVCPRCASPRAEREKALRTLLESGLITPEEYEAKREAL